MNEGTLPLPRLIDMYWQTTSATRASEIGEWISTFTND
jgi:hypothetical protein